MEADGACSRIIPVDLGFGDQGNSRPCAVCLGVSFEFDSRLARLPPPGDMLRASLRRPLSGVFDPGRFSQGKVRPAADVDAALDSMSVVLVAFCRAVRGCSAGNWARPRRGEGVRDRRGCHASALGDRLRRRGVRSVWSWGEATCGFLNVLRRGVARGFFAELTPSRPGVCLGLDRGTGALLALE